MYLPEGFAQDYKMVSVNGRGMLLEPQQDKQPLPSIVNQRAVRIERTTSPDEGLIRPFWTFSQKMIFVIRFKIQLIQQVEFDHM